VKDNSPAVTVLMPVYNGRRYLDDAIESILKQTYKDFEFLIIDDGSTDESEEIIRSYSDNRIRLVCNQKNIGLAATLNQGIGISHGKYVVRMDCDDISLPERLETQFYFMEKNPRIAVCGTWVDTFGSINSTWKYPLENDEMRSQLLFASCLVHPSVIIRKASVIKDCLYYDESFIRSQDYELWVRISKKHVLANIGKVLLKLRIHENKVGEKFKVEQIEFADVVRHRQISELGISATKDELAMHSNISRWRYELSEQFLNGAEEWLMKLSHSNKTKQIFEEVAFHKELGRKWWYMCNSATGLGLRTWRLYWHSTLSKYMDLTWKQKIMFLKRCITKNGNR